MSNINTGGPAFPTENARQTGPSSWHEEGMTLRDYFAAKAIPALVPLSHNELESWVDLPPDGFKAPTINLLASIAYEISDAMLRAREAA